MLKVTRGSTYEDRLRNYQIFVDNRFYGEIGRNQTLDIVVEKGIHTVFAKIDWCRSNEIEVQVKDTAVNLEVGSSLIGWKIFLWLLYITFFRKNYLWIKEISVNRVQ
ncbi:MAG: hypothetical protein LBP68_00750 [Acidobacteriota bacterium]|nr:hypothetical protein [Acidobacteriota bacterium]